MFDLIPHRKGATNAVPSFITQYGPTREVRFARKPDGSPDGGVHQLFTVVGRSDIGSPGCTTHSAAHGLSNASTATGNTRFRIPLQLFGLGMIDGIQDSEILARHAATAAIRGQLGIEGHSEPQRQRRHDHALRLEGPEQVDRDFRRRGLQRRDGHHERRVPASDRGNAPCTSTRASRTTSHARTRMPCGIRASTIRTTTARLARIRALHAIPRCSAARAALVSAQRGRQLFGTNPEHPGWAASRVTPSDGDPTAERDTGAAERHGTSLLGPLGPPHGQMAGG